MYRPFCKQNLYYEKDLIERPGIQLTAFNSNNIIICVKGIGEKDFSCSISINLSDYQLLFNSQCLPLYWYEENKNPQATLFDDAETDIKFDEIFGQLFADTITVEEAAEAIGSFVKYRYFE